MPKLIPVADALSKPFWGAVNQKHFDIHLEGHWQN
jgi:hypothetical protein